MTEEQGAEVDPGAEITSDDKLWAALGYPIAIIALLVLFMEDKKSRPFIKFHAVQSLALNIVLGVVAILLSFTVIGVLCLPVFWLVTLWPAYDSYQGNFTEIPVISDFIRNQGWV